MATHYWDNFDFADTTLIRSAEITEQAFADFVNPDTDTHIDTIYDLRASPTLYLLDKNKRVLLKDAPIEQIEQYLTTQ